MIISQKIQSFLCLLGVLLLSGCGFHLRGNVDLAPPLQRLYLQTTDPYGELTRHLVKSLRDSHVVLTNTPQEAATILNITNEQETQQLLSVGGTQQTRQYNLNLSVTFEVTTPAGVTLLQPQTVTETRSLTVQADQILGGSNEKNTLFSQMRRAISASILNRLAANRARTAVMEYKTTQ